jgi:shikimate kinase
MDLDEVIVQREGRSIPEIFAQDGEKAFRRMELEAFKAVTEDAEGQGTVLALGGGTVTTAECADIAHNKTLCIYMKASVQTLKAHLEGQTEGRPLLCGQDIEERLARLMYERGHIYEKTAHIIIDTDGKSISEIAQEILRSSHHAR